ncbi:MAG: restriction endonuclease subunit S [Paludibacteraceae bacterium]|nr:restriction endonuclease subunit S [Paludibacteraceae bacterium]
MKILTNIPQGYKSSPLGIIPKDWEVLEFGQIADVAGKKYTPSQTEHVPCIELEHMVAQDGGIYGYTDSANQESTKNVFEVGDVLFGKLRPYLRKFWLATFNGVCSSEIWVFKNKKCSSKYLYDLLQSDRFIQNANVSFGSKMPRADWNYLQHTLFPLPPLAEQERIAELLGTWDRAIEMQKQLIDKLELRKKGLMQQLLPAKGHRVPNLRFPEFVNTMKWTEKRVADIFQITRGLVLATTSTKNKPDTKYKYPVYSSQTKDGGLMGYYDNFLYEDAITWTTDGANAGTVFFRSGKFYCTNVCGVLINKEGYANQCLAEIIGKQSKKYVSYVGNPKLMNNVMAEIPVCVPSLQELRKIACFLSSIDEQIATEKNKLALFQVQKQGLMQVLLTGKKRI